MAGRSRPAVNKFNISSYSIMRKTLLKAINAKR